MIRTKLLLGSYILFLLAACDNATPQNARPDSGPNPNVMDSAVLDSGSSNTEKDAGVIIVVPPPRDSGSDNNNDNCRKTCETDDCGKIPDGCDDFLDCGGCSGGMLCGARRENKCDYPKPIECEAKTAAELCPGKCGAVSDECSGVVMCNDANGGVTCNNDQHCADARCESNIGICTPFTCADRRNECGVDTDGCGGSITCPICSGSNVCKYSDEGNTCVAPPPPITCTPLTQEDACEDVCGTVGDGCGDRIECPCPSGEECGGGGTPNVCAPPGGPTCVPTPAATACAGRCGDQADGCGGIWACTGSNGGETCDAQNGESCGGGGVPNKCGKIACIPRSQADACPPSGEFKACGSQPDNCGGLVECGGCPQDQICGLNRPSVCGARPVCQPTPATTACSGKCGSVPDGCGGVWQCNSSNGGVTCTGEEYCGANNNANRCGIPPVSCMPKTCNDLGHTCGFASDGCGRVLNCWQECANSTSGNCTGTCGSTSACLANSNNGGRQSCVAGTPACTGSLCSSVPPSCASNSLTTLTGTVRTPGRVEGGMTYDQLPVPNALVYIPAEPNSALPTIFEGVAPNNTASCGRCNDEKLVADGQSLLAAAVTDYKGDFVLQGRVPVGTPFKLVIKVGKWRRVVQVAGDVAASCATRALPAENTRLAATSTDGLTGTRLPKIAVSTGDVDAMECVLRGIGIADSEFTLPSGTGRIHMYRSNGARMDANQVCSGTYGTSTVRNCADTRNVNNVDVAQYGCVTGQTGCSWNTDRTLYASDTSLNPYDMVVFDCEGERHYVRNATQLGRLLAYANSGGRVFASHWSYEWLDNNGSMDMASSWINTGSATSGVGFVALPSGSTMRTQANATKSLLYRDWLDYQGALTGTMAGALQNPATPQLNMTDPRDVAGSAPGASTDEWMYRNSIAANKNNPTSSTATDLKTQQLSFNTPYGLGTSEICGRVAFSAFHVAATQGGSTLSTRNLVFPAECHSGGLTAQEKTLAFMLFDLGACVSAGDPPQPPACQPKTATDLCPGVNDACGFVSDGCGGVVDCAGCAAGNYCDGNICRTAQCTPQTCASLGYTCGTHADGCSGVARDAQGREGCGACVDGQECGLNTAGTCGGCVKIPMATACQGFTCGSVSDGCGGTYSCGTCTSPAVCGGGGTNRCGTNPCTPASPTTACANPTKNCGLVADGCGGTISCGTCTQPDTCGGNGFPNRCGRPTCTPKTLQDACSGLNCGWVSDGCGGALNCGTCPNGGVCGGMAPNRCGEACTPTTCSAKGAECGNIADQCGALLNCGPCPSGQTCGAGGTPNKCGAGTTCTPGTRQEICTRNNATCGLVGDGCGGAVDCGTCTMMGQTCNGSGMTPNNCSTGTMGCNKLTCQNQGSGKPAVQCGSASDGCGGLLNCGACASGSYCSNGMCVVSPG